MACAEYNPDSLACRSVGKQLLAVLRVIAPSEQVKRLSRWAEDLKKDAGVLQTHSLQNPGSDVVVREQCFSERSSFSPVVPTLPTQSQQASENSWILLGL